MVASSLVYPWPGSQTRPARRPAVIPVVDKIGAHSIGLDVAGCGRAPLNKKFLCDVDRGNQELFRTYSEILAEVFYGQVGFQRLYHEATPVRQLGWVPALRKLAAIEGCWMRMSI